VALHHARTAGKDQTSRRTFKVLASRNIPVVPQTAIILNPRARSERADAMIEEVHRLAPEAEIFLTTAAGDARRLAAEAANGGFEKVVAAGGDGTVNEVVNGLAGTTAKLGVLPLGTMNVFAKEHGLPDEMEPAWSVINADRTREIDFATVNGAHFIQLAGVGLDAQIVKETSWETKRSLGPLSYVLSAASVAARNPPTIEVEAAGKTREGSFVLIGNQGRVLRPDRQWAVLRHEAHPFSRSEA
jgi:diacylglycerol kinase (ATP)